VRAERNESDASLPARASLSETIPDAVTFDFGAGVSLNALVDGHFSSAPIGSSERGTVLAFGCVQRAGAARAGA